MVKQINKYSTLYYLVIILLFCQFTYLYGDNIKFKTFNNDPLNIHYCELENGLRIYFIKIKKNTDINIDIVYKVGSKDDPQDNTGLAHYLEHLMFHGTTKICSIDYKKEKPLLDKIENLFEELKKEKDENKKDKLLKKIEEYSLEASKYAIYYEFDTILKSCGCNNRNAYTGKDYTSYFLTIKKQYLERAIKTIAEQHQNPIFRNFYNELQVVYEEYIENNKENSYKTILNEGFKNLFNKHPYKNPVLGEVEHLRKPSIKGLIDFYKKYYVPNNCSIILSGDIDYNRCYDLIKKYFGDLKRSEIKRNIYEKEDIIKENKEINVYNEERELAAYFYKCKINDPMSMCKTLLATEVLISYLSDEITKDSTCNYFKILNHILKGIDIVELIISNKNRQSLDDAKKRVLNKIKDFCDGKFSDRLVTSQKNKYIKILRDVENYDKNLIEILKYTISNNYDYQEFIDSVNYLIKNLSKDDVIKTIKNIFETKSILINKHIGGRNYDKIEARKHVDVNLNNNRKSKFRDEVDKIPVEDIQIQNIDYKKDIKKIDVNDNVNIYFTKKNNKKLFNIYISYNYGIFQNILIKYLGILAKYLKSDNLTSSQFDTEMNELSTTYNFVPEGNVTTFKISGLSENLEKTLNLLGNFIQNATLEKKYENILISELLNLNLDIHNKIAKKLLENYETSTFKKNKIKTLKKRDFDNLIKEMLSSNCDIYVDSDMDYDVFINKIKKSGLIKNCKKKFTKNESKYRKFSKNTIYIIDIKGSQNVMCEIMRTFDKNDDKVTPVVIDDYIQHTLWSEIRSKGLIYDLQSGTILRDNNMNTNIHKCMFSTQPNKFNSTFESVIKILDNSQFKKSYYNNVIDNLKTITVSKRYNNKELLLRFIRDKELDIDTEKTNFHTEIYNKLKKIELKDVEDFYSQNIKNEPKIIFIAGNIQDIDFDLLKKYGEINVL